MPLTSLSPVGATKRVTRRFVLILLLLSAPALAYPGEQLLAFSANHIVGPLGLFSLVLALAGSFFRPDLVRSAVYAAIICAVLFFVIKMAPQLMNAMKA